MSCLDNFLIGVVSGLVSGLGSSWIITQIYRQIDKQQGRFEYINGLFLLADEFENALFHAGTVDVEDEYVFKLKKIVANNYVPRKKKWVKLKKEERKVCNDFITFYNTMTQEIFKCHLDMQRKPEEKLNYISEIENAKLKFSTISHMEALVHKSKLIDLRKTYTD